jgi:ATP-dependent Clp protease ATP-binding subunit ClpA
LSVVLFDEIEKAAPSMIRLLLGVLDKATLRLGDNTTVNFERSIIFMTSNLGAREMLREISPEFGFDALRAGPPEELDRKLEKIGMSAVRRKFPPEFVNRLDGVVTYVPLDEEALNAILDCQLAELQQMVDRRLGQSAFRLDVSEESRKFLLENGTSSQYGARELKRTIHRHVVQPIASMLVAGGIEPGTVVAVDRDPENGLAISIARAPSPRGRRLKAA